MNNYKLLIKISIFFLLVFKTVSNPKPVLAQTCSPSPTVNCSSGFTTLYNGITYKRTVVASPRNLVWHIIKVDLNNPDIDLFVTPEYGLGTTTSFFSTRFGADIAINGGDFLVPGQPTNYAASQGFVYSTGPRGATVWISQNNSITIGASAPGTIWDAITGMPTIVESGNITDTIQNCENPANCTTYRARTSVGINSSTNELIIVVVDENPPDVSQGVNLCELAYQMLSCNVSTAVNMDGGGSSTLVQEGTVINSLSDTGGEHLVSNHLGICANGCAPLATPPSPPPTTGNSVSRSCTINSSEPHPLRPYPAEICGFVKSPDQPFCAMRPWAVKEIEYMKNIQECADPNNPCIQELVGGDYSIDLSEYELPLTSVNRPGFENILSFFNRAQEHLADYLEGRAYYEGILEPSLYCDPYDPYSTCDPSDPSTYLGFNHVWNRLGVLRKLLPQPIQNRLKSQNIQNAQPPNQTIHNYIVGYESGGQPANWGTGNQIRMADFNFNQPPQYTCAIIINPQLQSQCQENYNQTLEVWQNTIYGKLWPYVPLVSREDTIGYVSLNPEPGKVKTSPGGAVITDPLTNEVSIPHLNRLNEVSNILQGLLSSRYIQNILQDPYSDPYSTLPETEPFEGSMCPAGPFDYCPTGPGGQQQLSDLGCPQGTTVNCIQSVTTTDSCVKNQATIEDLASRWISGAPGNHVSQCYNDVIARASDKNINPSLAMLIWLNESNASNYNLTVYDYGVLNNLITCSFTDQISAFLDLPGYYRTIKPLCYANPPNITDRKTGEYRPMTDLEIFLAIFQSGDCDIDSGQNYAQAIVGRWDWVSTCDVPTEPEI